MDLSNLKLASLASAIVLSACGGGGGDTPLSESNKPAGLDGTWLDGCVRDNTSGRYLTNAINFTGFSITRLQRGYDNADCMGSFNVLNRQTGRFSIGDELAIGSGETAFEIDVTISSQSPNLNFRDLVQTMNNELRFGANLAGSTRPSSISDNPIYSREP